MDDVHLRQSHNSDDLEQDRRLINKKLQLRRSRQTTSQQQEDEEEEDDPSVLDYYYNNNNNNNDINDVDFDTFYENNGGDGADMEEYMLRQAHEHDEQLIGGKVVTEEGFEAMNQALTSPPVAWWAKRKQWQKRRSGGAPERLVGGLGLNISSRSVGNSNISGRENNYGRDESNRVDNNGSGGGNDQETGNEQQRYMMSSDEGVLGHPVMLTDPTSMGYDTESFRQRQDNGIYSTSSSSSNNKKKRKPAVLFVPRSTIKRRSAQQMAYIISALCVIFLFMFFLEQIKLSHYAMVESPLPLSAYLAGERYDESTDGANNNNLNKVTLGSLGLEEFDGKIQGIPVVEFGKIQVDRDDPIAQQMMTETATDGSGMSVEEEEQQSAGIIHGADYFEILKGVITGWGITPSEILANEESPQYKALHWMAYEDILRRQPDTDFKIKKIIQRYVLSVIYFATAGELWRHSALFLSNLDECSWNVKIEPKFFLGAGGCEEGLITRLDLWGNHLTVSIVVLKLAYSIYFSSHDRISTHLI